MNKLKDTLNNLFDEIRKLEAEGNIAEASELTDAFLVKSGEPSKWVYQCNKTGSNIDYDIASKILYLTEGESYDGLSDNGLRMFTQIFLTGTQGRKSPKEACRRRLINTILLRFNTTEMMDTIMPVFFMMVLLSVITVRHSGLSVVRNSR